MKDFVITTSSTCDLNPYFLRKLGIYYVSFYYYINEERFYDNFFEKHSVDEFYKLVKTENVKTSQPDPEQYKELWLKLIEQGNDILHIEMSTGISGAYNSALIAKSLVEEIKPDAKIYVLDSLCACAGLGLLLDDVANFKQTHNDIETVVEYVEKYKLIFAHTFFCTSLDQYIKGGRVSKLAGGVGKLLNICPILHVDNEGKLIPIKKARGINGAIEESINIMKEHIEDGLDYSGKVFISNSNCLDDAKKMCNRIKETFKKADASYDYIFNIGSTIGCHTGNGTIAIFYRSVKR